MFFLSCKLNTLAYFHNENRKFHVGYPLLNVETEVKVQGQDCRKRFLGIRDMKLVCINLLSKPWRKPGVVEYAHYWGIWDVETGGAQTWATRDPVSNNQATRKKTLSSLTVGMWEYQSIINMFGVKRTQISWLYYFIILSEIWVVFSVERGTTSQNKVWCNEYKYYIL